MEKETDDFVFPEEWKEVSVKSMLRDWIEQSGVKSTALSEEIYGQPNRISVILGQASKSVTAQDIADIGRALEVDETTIDQLQQRLQ